MRYSDGLSLLELMIALALSTMIFFMIDTVYTSLWITRGEIERSQEAQRLRELPQQLFADLLYHAGHLGCRAVRDGVVIKAPANIPKEIFIHQGLAFKLESDQIWVHETQAQTLIEPILEGTMLKPIHLKDKSDWFLISDCQGAELLPYGGYTSRQYQRPVTLMPIIVSHWVISNQTLYRHQVYPLLPTQPILTSVEAWSWESLGTLVRLRWKTSNQWDDFVFELGNT